MKLAVWTRRLPWSIVAVAITLVGLGWLSLDLVNDLTIKVFGPFGIVDAMFAPVALRFAGYGVALDATASAYVEAILALPAMREWIEAALAEPEVIEASERRG